jgi:hypothetical protein
MQNTGFRELFQTSILHENAVEDNGRSTYQQSYYYLHKNA